MCPHGGRLISGAGSLLGTARIICHCLLVEGAEGLVLVDTGFGLDDMRNTRQLGLIFDTLFRPQAREAETAIEQVRALGFAPDDVRHIIATHLDVDHAGGLPDFPDAQVHVLGRELKAAMHPSWRERQRYVAAHWAHGPDWVQHEPEGDEWLGFESVRILPDSDAEILLVPLIGHTRGHAAAMPRSSCSARTTRRRSRAIRTAPAPSRSAGSAAAARRTSRRSPRRTSRRSACLL